ncbi:hypothetical protein [Jatrophihabitans sp.]|jgi:hypothetical protein|uniref:hypothetical protein n=1 Tax=Jatrophihabitans sp. TaxID=1932789 RepID=UPI0038CDC636
MHARAGILDRDNLCLPVAAYHRHGQNNLASGRSPSNIRSHSWAPWLRNMLGSGAATASLKSSSNHRGAKPSAAQSMLSA